MKGVSNGSSAPGEKKEVFRLLTPQQRKKEVCYCHLVNSSSLFTLRVRFCDGHETFRLEPLSSALSLPQGRPDLPLAGVDDQRRVTLTHDALKSPRECLSTSPFDATKLSCLRSPPPILCLLLLCLNPRYIFHSSSCGLFQRGGG